MLHKQRKVNLAETRETRLKCLRGDRGYGTNGTAIMSLLILVICHLATAAIGTLEIHREIRCDLIKPVAAQTPGYSQVLFRQVSEM